MRAARGGVPAFSLGVITIGALSVLLQSGEGAEYSCTVSNPAGINGRVLYYVSSLGAAYVVQSTSATPIATLNFTQPNGVPPAVGAFSAYVEFRDLRGELLARTNIVSGTQPA